MATGFSQERIELTLSAVRAFWAGERREPLLSVHTSPDYRQHSDPEAMAALAAACIQADGASGEANVLPTLIPDFGTISMPAMWGGRIIPADATTGRCVHIEPLCRTIGELEELPAPRPFEETDFQRAIDLYGRVCDRLESREVFTRTPDFQGPMNTLALLLDQTELMVGLYEAPEAIERALDHITDIEIAYLARYRSELGADRVVGNVWPYVILPDGCGIGITQDYMPLLGPEMYARFEVPRLKRIADAFGGVFIHCCGEYTRHLPTLAAADFKIWGLEMHYPCAAPWDAYKAFGDRIAYVPYVAPTGHEEYPTRAALAGDITRRMPDARIWHLACHGDGGLDALRQAVRDHGVTCPARSP